MTGSLARLSLLATALVAGPAAQAAVVNFQYTGVNGYTAVGSFAYDAATAPAVINEANGLGATNAVSAFSVTFRDPSNAVLETGSSVIGGISSDRFFRLTYDIAANLITTIDADVGGSNYAYFLTNLRTPTGQVVPAGQTGFNFFRRATANAALDTATSVSSAVVPSAAPAPAPAMAGVFAAIAFALARRRAA